MRRCLDCDVLMRSARVPAEAVPLSRVFGGQGLCKTCHGRRMRGFVPAADISEGFDEGQARSALEAWLSDRRRRIDRSLARVLR